MLIKELRESFKESLRNTYSKKSSQVTEKISEPSQSSHNNERFEHIEERLTALEDDTSSTIFAL